MGKSKHASFSSIDKPNFQHIRAKLRGNSLKKKLKENEKNGGNSETEEKEKKRFWCKFLGFVRKRWSSTESCQNASNTEMAVINQYQRAQHPETPQENFSVFPELPQVECGKEKADEQEQKNEGLNWNVIVNSEESKNNGPLLTSALFIRQDLDKIVESAVLIEPNLPRDYADFRTSDEISQKSTKCNKKRMVSKITEERIDPIVRTFKTASEPTCKERTKIIQHQRLKDNINNLIKQFMFLEAEDILDFSVSQNVNDYKEKIQCSSTESKTPLLRELSKEVSPEILVNKKPFKEYVSNDFVNFENSSGVKIIRNHRDEDLFEQPIEAEEITEGCQTDPESCAAVLPMLKSSATFIKKKASNNPLDLSPPSLPSFPTTEKEIKNICYEDLAENTSNWGSSIMSNGTDFETPTCTIWGVYKSYPSCRNSVAEPEDGSEVEKTEQDLDVEEKVENSNVAEEKIKDSIQTEEVKDLTITEFCGRSLDEIIASLDDENHNIIFQKNLSQFKKKINVIPRFDVRKSAPNTIKCISDKTVQKIIKKSQNLQTPKPLKKSIANVTKITVGNPSANKIEKFRFECLELINRQRAQRVLENVYLTPSDAKLLSRTLSTRVEARTVSFLQTLREVYALMENNNSTIMEMVIPHSFETDFIKITLIQTKSSKAINWTGRLSSGTNKTLPLCDFNKTGIQSESSSSFLDTDECLFLSQDLVSLHDIEPIDLSAQDITPARVVRTSTETLIKASVIDETEEFQIESDELEETEETKETNVTSRTENVLIFQPCFEAPQIVVEILNNSYRAYPVQIYENVLPFRKRTTKNLSDSDLVKRVEYNLKKSYSDSAIASVGNVISIEALITLNEKTLAMIKKKDTNCGFDGFQILYNNSKENLDDEEEIIKPVFGRRLLGKDPGFIIENIYKEEEEEEEEEEHEEEEELKKKNKKTSNEDTAEKSEKKTRNILKFKSNSSPRENIIHTDFCVHEHRFRRSFLLSKDMEKDIRKRRFHLGKGVDVRRTGSAILGNKGLYPRNSLQLGLEETLKHLILPDEIKTILASESKGESNKKIFVVDKSGANVKKELVVAAFNSIKEFHSCKGEAKDGGKRMSLVIMLSKK